MLRLPETKSAGETLEKLRSVIWDFFQKRHIGYYIAFLILYRLAEGFVMKVVPLFLKAERSAGGLGLNEQEIGLYYGTYGAAAFVLALCWPVITYRTADCGKRCSPCAASLTCLLWHIPC